MAPAVFWSILLLSGALRSPLCRFCLSWWWLLLTCLFLPVYLLAFSADVTKTQMHISRMLGAAERTYKVNSSIQDMSTGVQRKGREGSVHVRLGTTWTLFKSPMASLLLAKSCFSTGFTYLHLILSSSHCARSGTDGPQGEYVLTRRSTTYKAWGHCRPLLSFEN